MINAVLEVPEVRRQVFPVPVELYHRLTEGLRTELLRGTIIEKMSKSPIHRKLVERLRRILASQVEPQWLVFQDGPITTNDSEPEPDLAIVVGPIERYDQQHPATAELVIEMAVTSLEIDRIKAAIYADAGVKEYWIVCPEEKRVEVYRTPRAEGYAEQMTKMAPAILESAVLPLVRIDLGRLFA